MDDRVLEAMLPYLKENYGNANGKYSIGFEARNAVNAARKSIAQAIQAEPDEIYFTSGGTESNNTVINAFTKNYTGRIIISSEIEHDSVLEPLKEASKNGVKVRLLKPDALGYINLKDLERILSEIKGDSKSLKDEERILVSCMLVNNETGNLQPVKELAGIVHAYGCFFHTDAVQAAGHIGIDVKALGVDALSVSGHKLYGPKGTGFLYLKRGHRIPPLIFGGGQERGLRSGTENVPGIVGLGRAVELAKAELDETRKKESVIAGYFKDRLLKNIPDSSLNGEGSWILNFSFAGINGTSLALRLDMEGICVSTGSACSAGLDERSHVLTAMGLTQKQTDSSIRISIGKYNTKEEACYTCDSIERLVSELRSLGI